jgi:patatin-like phospholipase/acyl hydrolase
LKPCSRVLARRRRDPAHAPIGAKWDGVDEPRIADCFHLIAGTSTAGLLTAGLTITAPGGRPKFSAADAVRVYENDGGRIFHRPLLRNILDHFNLLFPLSAVSAARSAS